MGAALCSFFWCLNCCDSYEVEGGAGISPSSASTATRVSLLAEHESTTDPRTGHQTGHQTQAQRETSARIASLWGGGGSEGTRGAMQIESKSSSDGSMRGRGGRGGARRGGFQQPKSSDPNARFKTPPLSPHSIEDERRYMRLRASMAAGSVDESMSPAAAAAAATGTPIDEDECLLCLEPFHAADPKVHSLCRCGVNKNSFHLGCLNQWNIKAGKSFCVMCDEELFFEAGTWTTTSLTNSTTTVTATETTTATITNQNTGNNSMASASASASSDPLSLLLSFNAASTAAAAAPELGRLPPSSPQ